MRPEASTLTPKFWLRTCASSGVIWEMATEYWYLPYVMVQKLELHWRIPDFSGNLSVDKEMLISYGIKGHWDLFLVFIFVMAYSFNLCSNWRCSCTHCNCVLLLLAQTGAGSAPYCAWSKVRVLRFPRVRLRAASSPTRSEVWDINKFNSITV